MTQCLQEGAAVYIEHGESTLNEMGLNRGIYSEVSVGTCPVVTHSAGDFFTSPSWTRIKGGPLTESSSDQPLPKAPLLPRR